MLLQKADFSMLPPPDRMANVGAVVGLMRFQFYHFWETLK